MNCFKEKLSEFNSEFERFEGISDKIKYFYDSLNQIHAGSCPLKIKYISVKRIHKPWINNDIMILI